jgi:glycerol-3-phosphate dehydrogenase
MNRTASIAPFDLAIVGGGSLGCALAWEAATRGLKVALLEQEDFGSAASANSLKIVHGGLRYLQKMDLARARASAFERSVFLRVAPHLVQPLPCIMPTRRSLMRGRLAMAGGLAVNALVTFDRNRGLAADRRLPAGGLVSLATVASLAPGLNLDGATAGARWFDAQMVDSERLPLAFALGAEAHGAVLINHHRVTDIVVDGGRVRGLIVDDCLGGSQIEIDAAVVADCRCAWGRRDAGLPVFSDAPPFIKAVNLILPETELRSGLGFPMRDKRGEVIPGRMLFATPWNGVTIVGTWYSEDARGPGAGISDAVLAAMLASVNDSYGGWHFSPQDVRAVHIGFLPAIRDSVVEGLEPIPMDKPMCEPAAANGGPAGLWYLQTEKWTTVRRLAQHFLDRLVAESSTSADASATANLPLHGGNPDELAAARLAIGRSALPAGVARRIEAAYGGHAPEVLDTAARTPDGMEVVPGTDAVLVGELLHAIEREHARTLGDLVRRTAIGSAGRPARETLESIAQMVAEKLEWTAAEQRQQVMNVLNWPQFRMAADPGPESVQKWSAAS